MSETDADPLTAAALSRAFYARAPLRVARDLLGKILVHATPDGIAAGRIVEVEAYRGVTDRACHTFGGRRTARNAVMWGRPGLAYVYFTYGMHWMLNAVTSAEDVPEAVLIRALEPVAGLELMRMRRHGRGLALHVARGPANLCSALGIEGERNGTDLTSGELRVLDAQRIPARRIRRTARIGVAYAGDDATRPWRLILADSPALSGPRALNAAAVRLSEA